MIETIIRYIIIAIVLGVIGEVISHLSSKTTDENISTTHYRVKAPAVLKYACMSQFILGMIMFLVFSYFYLKGNETVEMGHLYVSSIFGGIGLYGVIWASIWGVLVNDPAAAGMPDHGHRARPGRQGQRPHGQGPARILPA